MSDPEVLALAAEDGRILVTHDGKTMPRHFGQHLAHAHSAGVLVVPQSLPVSIAAEQILLIASATEAEEWVDRISRLPL